MAIFISVYKIIVQYRKLVCQFHKIAAPVIGQGQLKVVRNESKIFCTDSLHACIGIWLVLPLSLCLPFTTVGIIFLISPVKLLCTCRHVDLRCKINYISVRDAAKIQFLGVSQRHKKIMAIAKIIITCER